MMVTSLTQNCLKETRLCLRGKRIEMIDDIDVTGLLFAICKLEFKEICNLR